MSAIDVDGSPVHEIKDPDRGHFFIIVNDAIDEMTDDPIGPHAGWLFTILKRHADGSTGKCHPSYNRLAKLCGMSRSTVIKALETLERRGIISVEARRSADKSQTSNEYTITPRFVATRRPRLPETPPPSAKNTTPVCEANPNNTVLNKTEMNKITSRHDHDRPSARETLSDSSGDLNLASATASPASREPTESGGGGASPAQPSPDPAVPLALAWCAAKKLDPASLEPSAKRALVAECRALLKHQATPEEIGQIVRYFASQDWRTTPPTITTVVKELENWRLAGKPLREKPKAPQGYFRGQPIASNAPTGRLVL